MERISLNSALARFNGAQLTGEQRSDLIARGKVLVLEAAGRAHNDALVKANRPAVDIGSTIGNATAFASAKNEWADDVLYFCAERALAVQGREADRADRTSFTASEFASDPIFLRTLAGIVSEIQYAVTPPIVNELVGDMASTMVIPKGKTGQIEITSNAVFQWYDSTWTSLRSVPQDQLYNACVTINPTPKATRFHINYYQMVANSGSLVDTLAAVSGGYGAKLMETFSTAFQTAYADVKYVPAARKATGYTDSNWATIVRNVAAANRVRRDQLIAYGDFLALRKVLPDNATLAPAIMTLLGDEYFKNGYLMSHDGVMLYELTPTSTPATINTTMTSAFPTDTIIVAARANMRYAPMVIGFEEGGEGRIDLTPGDNVIADGFIEGLSYASYDIAPVFTSAIGVISSIS
jgi:hypothetical protein